MDPNDIYGIIEKIKMSEFQRFAKTHLRVTECDIEQAEHQDPKIPLEQRYTLVRLWELRNGRQASIEELQRLVDDFRRRLADNSQPRPQVADQHLERPQQQSSAPQLLNKISIPTSRDENSGYGHTEPQARCLAQPSRTAHLEDPARVEPIYENKRNPDKTEENSGEPKQQMFPPPTSFITRQQEQYVHGGEENENLQLFEQQETIQDEITEEEKEDVAAGVQNIAISSRPPLTQHSTGSIKIMPQQGAKNQSSENFESAKAFEEQSLYNSEKSAIYQLCSPPTLLMVDNCSRDLINIVQHEPDYYKIDSHLKGYILIFNNLFKGEVDQYGKSMERHGSRIDVDNLKRLWKKMGCEVKEYPDQKAADIFLKLQRFIQSKKRTPCDFVSFFFMSHGNSDDREEYFLGSDHQRVEMSKLLLMFNNDYPGTTLREIPKLVFLQFCRGEDLDGPVKGDCLKSTFPFLSEFPKMQETDDVVETDGQVQPPKRSDILISYATQFGYKSLRDPRRGSWFINAIVNTFAKFGPTEHVLDMMTKVNDAVSQKSGFLESGQECKEMSEFTSTLRKKLYLLPGYTEEDF